MSSRIKELFERDSPLDFLTVQGWVRTRRDSKGFSFLEINDGSCLRNLQVVVDAGTTGFDRIAECTTGASVRIEGRLIASKGAGQKWELQATLIALLGGSDESYPLQKKGHSPEFLRTIAHLRPRTNLFGSIFRVRSRLALAVHRFFQERGFFYVQTPIITASDCEGAGEMFRVTTLLRRDSDGSSDGSSDTPVAADESRSSDTPVAENEAGVGSRSDRSVAATSAATGAATGADFFGRATYLTVSGQLEAEALACALGKVYTFGPTFRAENSNTARHAAEFWMIEPEMAFCDLDENMETAEANVKFLARSILEESPEEADLFSKFVDKGLRARLEFVVTRPFARLTYGEAVAALQASGRNFEFPVEPGLNLQSEHERWLTEEYCQSPVTVFNYPKEIKPFYMRLNDDGKTVAAMDVLVPGIGEIIGGSQREERIELLRANLAHHHLSAEGYWWYLDLRKFGTVPHAGYGMGFERMLMFVTGVSNIRDVIPFARTPGHCEF